MGIRLFSDSFTIKYEIQAPNPNPFKFEVIEFEIVGNNTIILIKYHGCTTFNGLKLLLLNIKWDGRKELDPHFLDGNHIVKARFEPTETGYHLARLCAENIDNFTRSSFMLKAL